MIDGKNTGQKAWKLWLPLSMLCASLLLGLILIVLGVRIMQSYYSNVKFVNAELPGWKETVGTFESIKFTKKYEIEDSDDSSTYYASFVYAITYKTDHDVSFSNGRLTKKISRSDYLSLNDYKHDEYAAGDRTVVCYDPGNPKTHLLGSKEEISKSKKGLAITMLTVVGAVTCWVCGGVTFLAIFPILGEILKKTKATSA